MKVLFFPKWDGEFFSLAHMTSNNLWMVLKHSCSHCSCVWKVLRVLIIPSFEWHFSTPLRIGCYLNLEFLHLWCDGETMTGHFLLASLVSRWGGRVCACTYVPCMHVSIYNKSKTQTMLAPSVIYMLAFEDGDRWIEPSLFSELLAVHCGRQERTQISHL